MKQKRLKVAVIGAGGRMGQELQKAIVNDPACLPFLGVVREGSAPGFVQSVQGFTSPLLKEADIWIDFSSIEGFSVCLKAAVRMGKPLVSGVTGLKEAQMKEMRAAGRKIPVLWSPNMSLGIAALKKALAVARELSGFDFQIEEIHHRHKKDKPSGTALYLQKELMKQVGEDLPEPIALRGGGVFGVHKVWMMSEEEVLCFEHQALNRAVFAKGAVQAARWLAGQEKGLYSIDEIFAGVK